MTTFATDTPSHVLSDYTEERCHELGLPCVRDDNGLTVTVPAKPDGLPDWETFLRVCHELQAADGWVMEGAEPDPPNDLGNYWDWYMSLGRKPSEIHDSFVPNSVYRYVSSSWPERHWITGRYTSRKAALADLSRACVEYSRSGGGK